MRSENDLSAPREMVKPGGEYLLVLLSIGSAGEEIERYKRGEPIVDHEDCEPLDLSEDPPGPTSAPPSKPAPEPEDDVEATFEAELAALQNELVKHIAAISDLMARAAAAGVLSDEQATSADVIPMRGPRREPRL